MKTRTINMFCLLLNIAMSAQSETRESPLLFNDFTQGTVLFKNKTTTKAMFNYDMLRQEMLFMDGENQMILQELHTIDTIYIEGRKFIPRKNIFLEKLKAGSTPFYVEWKVNTFTKLKEEGFGLISHGGGTDALNVSRTQSTGETTVAENVDYYYKKSNTYYLSKDKKMQKFNTMQGFIKLYPKDKTKDIQHFISDKKINIQDTDKLLILIEFADNLK